MGRKRKWQHQLEASKEEVLLAVDLYNRSGENRRLEAFVVPELAVITSRIENNTTRPPLRLSIVAPSARQ